MRKARYGQMPILGDEQSVTLSLPGGDRVTLTRDAAGDWTGGTLARPVRHLRDAVQAVRDHARLAQQRAVVATLRADREAAGLSQAALAERIGVTANTVARWERGELTPHPLRVAAIRRAVRVTLT